MINGFVYVVIFCIIIGISTLLAAGKTYVKSFIAVRLNNFRAKVIIGVATMILLLITVVAVHRGIEARRIEVRVGPLCHMADKISYVTRLSFDVRMVEDGLISNILLHHRICPYSSQFTPFFTDLVLVNNKAESESFPDYVIVAWPRMGETNFSERLVDGINLQANPDSSMHIRPYGETRDIVTLEDFELIYPLTIADLVSNWEKIYALWNAFDDFDYSIIISIASGWQP